MCSLLTFGLYLAPTQEKKKVEKVWRPSQTKHTVEYVVLLVLTAVFSQ